MVPLSQSRERDWNAACGSSAAEKLTTESWTHSRRGRTNSRLGALPSRKIARVHMYGTDLAIASSVCNHRPRDL